MTSVNASHPNWCARAIEIETVQSDCIDEIATFPNASNATRISFSLTISAKIEKKKKNQKQNETKLHNCFLLIYSLSLLLLCSVVVCRAREGGRGERNRVEIGQCVSNEMCLFTSAQDNWQVNDPNEAYERETRASGRSVSDVKIRKLGIGDY